MARSQVSRRHLLKSTLLAATWGALPQRDASAQEDPPSSDENAQDKERAEQMLKAMRETAHALKVVKKGADGAADEVVEIVPEPLFRHNGLTREYKDGTTWAWGKSGRPVAFCKLFTMEPLPGGNWVYCNTATSPDLIEMYWNDQKMWYPEKGDIEFKEMSDVRPPSDQPAARLRQLKELARTFVAYEVTYPPFSEPNTRHEMELKPNPVHRYSDPEHGILDGAVFIIAHEVEPEMILLIEAVKKDDVSRWQFAARGIGGAEFHLELGGQEVYKRAWARRMAGLPTESFFGFAKPKPLSISK